MLRKYVPRGAALVICLATASCAAPSFRERAAPPIEVEEALSVSVDALDVRHGSLRIEASMNDGSADVSMWLGGSCGDHEVGRGIATPAGFAWSLARDEVARAIECSLVVKVRAIGDDGQRVRRVAELPVSMELEEDGAETVRLLRQEARGASTALTFATIASAQRLHVAGTVLGAEVEDAAVTARLPKGSFLSSFVVSHDDLARSIVGRRRLSVMGEHFLATITVGGTKLEVIEPAPETDGAAEGRGEVGSDGERENGSHGDETDREDGSDGESEPDGEGETDT